MSSTSSTTKKKKDNTRRSNSEPARLRGRRHDSESESDDGARSMSRSRSRSRDREPRKSRHSDDGGRLARDSPLLADEQPKLGGMARAAVEQWGLDEGRLLAWAAARRLPGIGVADVNQYRQENPDEDLSAEMNGDLLGT
jgi:hypothetical protein